jgi:Tol biopolymer transport system component
MSIWQIGEDRRPKPVTANAGRYHGVAWLGEDIVTQSDMAGRSDLWRISADGARRVRLTDDEAYESDPVVCDGGKAVVFRSNKAGGWNLWRVDGDGHDLKPLTTGAGNDGFPSCGASGAEVYYTSYETGSAAIWRVPLNGGSPVQVTRMVSRNAAVSPDGKRLVSFVFDDDAASQGSVAVLSTTDGRIAARIKDIPATAVLGWHPNGEEITYVQTTNGVSNLVARSLDGVSSRQLTQFDTEQIAACAWSGDGKLACVRGIVQHDLIRVGRVR